METTLIRRSSQGYIIALFGGLINWKAMRQDTALSAVARETMALQRLFRDLELELGEPWKVFCDNQQTIRLVVGEKERLNTRLRHVDCVEISGVGTVWGLSLGPLR